MLNAEDIAAIDRALAHQPEPRGAIVAALQVVQARNGWVDDDDLQALARYLRLAPETVDALATYYSRIFRRPVGTHVISLCDGVVCWMHGAGALARHARERLAIETGETDSEGRFTLLPVACIGQCDGAPALLVDGACHRHVDAAALDALLDGDETPGGER